MHEYLWGKQQGLNERYPLIAHLLDTAGFAQVLWDHWLRDGLKDIITNDLGPNARNYVAAAAGLHDVGKANPVFQGQLNQEASTPWIDEMRQRITDEGLELPTSAEHNKAMRSHAQASAAHLTNTAGRSGRQGLAGRDIINGDWLAATALGHHGHFDLPIDTAMKVLRTSGAATWAPIRDDITDAVLRAVRLTPGQKWPDATPISTILISGLVILADRLASHYTTVIFRGQHLMKSGTLDTTRGADWLHARYPSFLKVLEDRLGIYQPLADVSSQVLDGHEPRGVQKEVSGSGDGLWMVMAPTGAGKTEAAMLRHGTSRERLIFCLPTMATTNAMANRVAKMFRATPNVAALEHSMRDLFDVRELGKDEGGCGGFIPSDFLSQGSNRLLGPVSVGTIDQVLLGSLRNKFTHLRLLSSANAHIVIDEAHLMDQYQTQLAANLFQWWGATGTRVTVLTATLPTWQRDKLKKAYDFSWSGHTPVSFPSHETISTTGVVEASRYLIEITKARVAEPEGEHVRWVTEMRSQFPDSRLGVVVNTVKRAQGVAASLRANGEDVILLHSRMTAKHRNRQAALLERKAGKNKRGKRFVVVGTQVIEASLDIDLDALSTDLAPAPSIIQRAGRVWRHYDPMARSRRAPGLRNLSVHIVEGFVGGSALPYFATELERVAEHLLGRNYLVMPDDSQAFIEASAFDIAKATTAESAERYDRRRHLTEAKNVTVDIDFLVQKTASYTELNRMTSNDDREAFTRLVTPPTATLLIMAPARAGVPGSWTRSVKDLATISDRSLAAAAMEGTVPVNGAIAAYAIGLGVAFDPAAPVLRRVIPVRVDEGRLRYDKVNGLYLLAEADA